MFKVSILMLASIFCITEASFRTEKDHQESFERAKAHPAASAALVVIAQTPDGKFSEFDATYIRPGVALTHSHQVMEPGRTWVVSRFAGAPGLTYNVDLDLMGGSFTLTSIALDIGSLQRDSSRVVTGVLYPIRRALSATVPESVSFSANDMPFTGDKREEYVRNAARNPLKVTGTEQSLTGPDFCLLQFAPFAADHPVAQLLETPFTGGKVEVLGQTSYTHVCDGSDLLLYNLLSDPARDAAASGLRKVAFQMTVDTPNTCFSQFARVVDNKLIVEAVCASTKGTPPYVDGDEIFDPNRTDPRITAMIVGGLSGAGVYCGDRLVGVVSCTFKSMVTEFFDKMFQESMDGSRRSTGLEKERFVSTARRCLGVTTDKLAHPLLNLHQMVTDEDVAAVLGSPLGALD